MNLRRILSRIYNKFDPPPVQPPIPKHELELRHVRNLRVLPDREQMIQLLPKQGVVAEIGVDQGDFSQRILSTGQAKLHLVDLWNTERYNDGKRRHVETRFAKEISVGALRMHLGYSYEVAAQFPDGYFDWIYIDTDHTYETTVRELDAYGTKVKPDGIIAGHDYILGNWDGGIRYGVIEAVHEFCLKHDWELIYLTTELRISPSFAIRRMQH